MKKRLAPMFAIHHYGNRKDQDEASRTAASPLSSDEQKARMPLITHPIVRAHPVTGRKALYAVSGSSFGIVGMPDDEACRLLDQLAAHATQPKYQYSLKYEIGDVVIWDNASLLHSATLTDPNDPRTLWRITIKEPALAAAAVLARNVRHRRDVAPRPAGSSGQNAQIESAFGEPDAGDQHDGRRASHQHAAPIKSSSAQPVGDRQKYRDDRQLTELDTHVECDQRDQQRLLRQTEIGQHAGEAEAMDQSEKECDQPPSAIDHRPQIVQRRQHHRRRDTRLDQPRRAGSPLPARPATT
jgi:hypothetical protein